MIKECQLNSILPNDCFLYLPTMHMISNHCQQVKQYLLSIKSIVAKNKMKNIILIFI